MGIYNDAAAFSSLVYEEINPHNNELVSFSLRLPNELFNTGNRDLSIGIQLDSVIDNLDKYEAERMKFCSTIDNINNGTELFYPPEAKTLFTEYLGLIEVLIDDLRSREYNLLGNLPSLPEQWEEEILSLS